MKNHIILVISLMFILASCGSSTGNCDSTTESENTDQWITLFDGKTLEGWRSFQMDTVTGWTIENGHLTALGEGSDQSGDIITTEQFEDFELWFEWNISPGGNSGVMFHVLENGYETTYATGPEYQLIDDEGFGSPLEDWQKTGANYAMHIPENKSLKPVGEFNSSRIIVDNKHVEHWLNGEKILEYELGSADWNERRETGKWKDYPGYGMAEKGHIALQDHGDKIKFRNIRIRELD